MKELEPIIKYKMNPLEAKAYKIALIWEEECEREITKEQYARLAKNSDPRKSSLFKYCYKLAREISGLIKDNEIPLYIRAQIQVLKSIREGDIHALIEPHCIVGDKAWKRWKIWKWKYNKSINKPSVSESARIRTPESKILSELLATKNFLASLGDIDLNEMKEDIPRWCKTGDLSCFYLVMSPRIKKIFGDISKLEFDHNYYRACITPYIEDFFTRTFSQEFQDYTCQK